MAENTKIEWADHTVNFWWGCAKISPACLNCYAEAQDRHFHPSIPKEIRFQGEVSTASHWGANAPRMLRWDSAREEAFRLDRKAKAAGVRYRIFTNSMSDFFEDRRDLDDARFTALATMGQTPNLDWMILTKRPERVMDLLKRAAVGFHGSPFGRWMESWIEGQAPANVWMGATVEDQARAQLRIPALLSIPARVRFLSCEPLLGPLDLTLQDCWLGFTPTRELLHWVICGGESGPRARPMHPEWVRGVRDQCAAARVPFLFKQWGEWIGGEFDARKGKMICQPANSGNPIGRIFWTNPGAPAVRTWDEKDHYWTHASARVGKKASGRLLDGLLHDGTPEVSLGQN